MRCQATSKGHQCSFEEHHSGNHAAAWYYHGAHTLFWEQKIDEQSESDNQTRYKRGIRLRE